MSERSGGQEGGSRPVLYLTHPAYLDHETGVGHPERPQRLQAVEAGMVEADLSDELVRVMPRPATALEIERVHAPPYVLALERFCRAGGGHLDPDTVAMTAASWDAAVLAAGAGLTAVELLRQGGGTAAFCALRPPGHHALAARAMGFCLFNNVAVTAAALAGAGERILVVDIDAHHGNGTQDTFYDDSRVTYVSFHQSPLYPGTGDVEETGAGRAAGTTVNIPVPPGATGDVYRRGIEDLVAPVAAEQRPDWLLISAGFDAHRADPLTDLGLTSGDYADVVLDLLALVPAGRRVVFLEGGYDLDALRLCTVATLGALKAERRHDERPTAGGPGAEAVTSARRAHRHALSGA